VEKASSKEEYADLDVTSLKMISDSCSKVTAILLYKQILVRRCLGHNPVRNDRARSPECVACLGPATLLAGAGGINMGFITWISSD